MLLGCIVQARMSSSRLPGKVLKNIENNVTVLKSVLNQLKFSQHIEKIVVATSTNHEDDEIEDFVKSFDIDLFRGSLNDLLDRHYQCSKEFDFSSIVRIPSDKPLIDPQIVDQVIQQFNLNHYDYASNFPFPLRFNIGSEVELFSFEALELAWKESKKPSEREHIFNYFHNNLNKFRILYVPNLENFSEFRFTVDRIEDLNLVRSIVSKIDKRPILIKDIIDLFEQEPTLKEFNKHIIFNEGQLKSLNDDKSSS
jgi:spore coat polysaccharide biosynthesis protein SpsF